MFARWHQDIAHDLAELFASVRPANDAHVQGLATLVELVRERDVASITGLVQAFHDWATPRLLAAAKLAAGAPLDQLTETEG